MSRSRERSGFGGAVAVVGAALVVVVCCAGPLLVAGGVLGAVGGVLSNPWLVAVGAVVLLAGTAYALRWRVRRRRGAGSEDCCPSVSDRHPHDRDDDNPGRDVR
ncbi:mercury transporter [Streptomyces chiangmaiensis]|uniref:Mercury transporter n=1 Tax=Streptomyces chiangmaiensis TaxID=766497 RepID=A0ABU7FVG7_9ACTN|nr:mercury transporter [Streptomyces chiangmaiensis]MED7828111.1 mercury transporter [Streptomyces chiangmaiensis]